MISKENTTWLVGAVGLLLLISAEIKAQDSIQNWNVDGTGEWNLDENWTHANIVFSGVPRAEFDDMANISNGGTAVVDEEVPEFIGLTLSRGTVDIQQGGALNVVDPGEAVIGDGGVLRLSGNGAFESGLLASTGLIELSGNDANLKTRGDFNQQGTLSFDVSSSGNAVVNAGGAANLGGTIQANFANDVNPSLGDSYPFLSGADSVSNNGAVISTNVSLQRGLGFLLDTTGTTAAISVSNLPLLSVNRVSGQAEISNVIGDPLSLTSYSIFSDSGLLSVDGWNSLADQQVEGWSEANPREQVIAELNVTDESTIEVGGSPLNLGNPYNGGAIHPRDEDVRFQVSLADGSVLSGLVEYVGPPNDLALRVDPSTGEAEISHQSSFIDPFDVTGYSIFSEAGALSVESWNSFADSGAAGDGWLEANPSSNALAEINPTGSNVFDNGTEIALGSIFSVGSAQDLVFQFTTVDSGNVITGTVEYGELGGVVLPGDCNGDGVVDAGDLQCVSTIGERDTVLDAIPTLAGDLDGDGAVAFPDFLVLSANFNVNVDSYTQGDIDLNGVVAFPDFLILSANFGKVPEAAAAAAAVPEPSGLALIAFGLFFSVARRRRA